MFKKIDMFVFWLGISFNIIVLFLGALLVFLGKLNPNQVKYYGTIIFYAIIFFYKLKASPCFFEGKRTKQFPMSINSMGNKIFACYSFLCNLSHKL